MRGAVIDDPGNAGSGAAPGAADYPWRADAREAMRDPSGAVAGERIGGVREDLPAGEHVLWQGAPDWRSLARRAFHIREVAGYFAILTAFTVLSAWADGQLAYAGLLPAGLGVLACALLGALAWMSSRTTIYAITTRRVFLRVGIALPIAVNLPLHRIDEARLALHADGSGDLPLCLEDDARLAYLHLLSLIHI